MPRKIVKGNTENLNILNSKIKYIGFELEKVPEFLKDFEPLNYRVPKVYDETTYKIYKYVKIKDIEILITPKDRLDELSERYKLASPLFTYMKPETNEDIEKYAYFLKMINQTNVLDIENIEKEQKEFDKEIPFDVKFTNNFKWQIFYSDYAKKYFMLASTNETDNSPMFYLLKRKIEENKSRSKKENTIFVPISNEEYSEKILKKSEIEDLENYLWYFTKNWPSIYEITDKEGNVSLQIVGEAQIYDKMVSKYRMILNDKQEAMRVYKLIKALFILSYDLQNLYKFQIGISKKGGIEFYNENKKIEYDSLLEFLKEEAISKIKENEQTKIDTKETKADIQDLKKKEEELNQEYIRKEEQIVQYMESKKTFMGRIRYFFKGKKKQTEEENIIQNSKNRMKEILKQDKEEVTHYNDEELENKNYTVEDIIKIGNELANNRRENKNAHLDLDALKNTIESIEKKIQNAEQYLGEIEKHRKSIFDFWKYANKDESKMLVEGEAENQAEEKGKNLQKTFDYETDIDDLASYLDSKQRENLTHNQLDAMFAVESVLDAINIVAKKELTKEDTDTLEAILDKLKEEYKANIEKIQKKDFDIFGNISEDKTKIKTLKNNKHREIEKDKFKVLNINLETSLDSFINKLKELRAYLEEEDNKIEIPYDLPLYKASNEKILPEGFNKFSLSPFETLDELEKIETSKETYLYKINVEKGTKLAVYSNIVFFENTNKTLPLGMDVSKECLINLDLYSLDLKDKEDFNINMFKDEFNNFVKKVKVYEYTLKKKGN